MEAAPSQYKQRLAQAVADAVRRIDGSASIDAAALLEKPRAAEHGDFSCPLPLALARQWRQKPLAIAEQIAAALELPPFVAAATVARPGFINFALGSEAKMQVVSEVLQQAEEYGRQPPQPHTVLLEFVSANPTGPLHVGHGRACAYGDALANIMQAAGMTVRREYYVNDAGRQMDILAASCWLRHWLQKEKRGDAMPPGAYRGDYLIAAAEQLAPLLADAMPPPALLESLHAASSPDAAADALVAAAKSAIASEEAFAALRAQIGDIILNDVIKEDMQTLGSNVAAINFYSESSLHESGKVEAAVQTLQARGALYEKDGALWFRASAHGDEKDRVVRRSSGELTYFAADIAYHADKLSRAHPRGHAYGIVNVLGADHHGYVPRLAAAMAAMGFPAGSMATEIIQFVALFENGQRLKMSTRAGEFITLRELVDAVGANAARYYYLNRKNDQHLDFDIAAARADERKNPMYYIHYANARIHSVMNNWQGDAAGLAQAPLAALAQDSAALQLCSSLIDYPELVRRAAAERAPHLLAAHLHDTAALLHNFYEQTRILPPAGEPPDAAMPARLALLWAAETVMNNCAALLGLQLRKKL